MIDDGTVARIRLTLNDYHEGDQGLLDVNDVADLCDAYERELLKTQPAEPVVKR